MIKTFYLALLFFILPEIFRPENARIISGLGQKFFFYIFFNPPTFPL